MVSPQPTDSLEDAPMRSITRNIALAVAALVLCLAPAAALADHGADDGARADDRGRVQEPGDDNGGDRDRGGDDDDGEQRVAGSCTGGATAKLKVKFDDGRIETEFEVDQNRTGVTWKVRVRRNGKLVIKTRATTTGRSGSFSVERKIGNPAGTDQIRARATSPSGEVCRASASI
jgi:hypothetical protein